jgi:hypothetical protein
MFDSVKHGLETADSLRHSFPFKARKLRQAYADAAGQGTVVWRCLAPKRAQKKSTSYSIRSTSMKRKSLIEAVSPAARDFIEAGTPKPQLCRRNPQRPKGKRDLYWFQNPKKQQLIRQKRKKYPIVGCLS